MTLFLSEAMDSYSAVEMTISGYEASRCSGKAGFVEQGWCRVVRLLGCVVVWNSHMVGETVLESRKSKKHAAGARDLIHCLLYAVTNYSLGEG